jgi:acyl-CoA synthetase (AMP-forming)/AMP-acid ligase II
VGQSGLLRIRALDGISGYLDDEETTRRFFHDGYFYPGDLGAFQPDGRLVLHGRVTNVVNVLGDKVPAETIETRLRDRLNAEEVCVFSFASEGADEELHVVIQSPRRISREELTAAIRDAVPRFPHAHVHLVGKIPRNDMGKVDRILLKRTVLAGAANSTKDAPGR